MSEFGRFQFTTTQNALLFNSEIESLIYEYCKEMDLILPDNFKRSDWHFYNRSTPEAFVEYSILFQARPKTQDDLIREQIEYQIQQLEK